MSTIDELPDLPDVSADVRDRVVAPPYEQVTRRVRARRGRAAAGTLVAAVLVVGGLAIWQEVATTASPDPGPSIPQPVDPAYPASADWKLASTGPTRTRSRSKPPATGPSPWCGAHSRSWGRRSRW